MRASEGGAGESSQECPIALNSAGERAHACQDGRHDTSYGQRVQTKPGPQQPVAQRCVQQRAHYAQQTQELEVLQARAQRGEQPQRVADCRCHYDERDWAT